ncbi:sensor histidine kinase [Nocardia sp. alder85J]|uniref:sensor histidine kinase n=1 Tax=Nocardia sp. alder85J TaxID=2862949 RepID=UPI001CD7A169|nr:HAMP domain-containing sensor histidine kinase [Nocardia sp. alder85J]MCX4092483.1 HAMP domain-containing sensor histidine kinase [Nocardia sp. alder85J]
MKKPVTVFAEPASLRRTARGAAVRAALVLAAVLLVAGAVLLVVETRTGNQQMDTQLAQVAAQVDDADDPPPGMAIGIVRVGRDSSVSDNAPAPTATLLAGPVGYSSVRSGGIEYRALVVERADRRVVVLVDTRPWEQRRHHVLVALLVTELAGLAAAAGAAVSLSRRAIRPMLEALAVQRDFVADASHELRAPLTVLHTRTQLLARRAAREHLEPAWRDQLDGLVADTRALADIVDDLLLAAAAEHRIDRREPVDLTVLCREVVDSVAAHAATLGISVELVAGDCSGAAIADGIRPALRRAVLALIDNALHHEKPGGTITVLVARGGGEVTVTVRDTGAGLDPGDAARLFQRFAHGDGHSTGTRPHGIGLALVRAVVEAHRGRITVDGAPGRGACFVLALPAARDR